MVKYSMYADDTFDSSTNEVVITLQSWCQTNRLIIHEAKSDATNRGYYMATKEYEFYLQVLKVSLTGKRSEQVRDTFSTRRY